MSRAEISRLLSGCTGLYLFNEGAGAVCNDYMGVSGPGVAWKTASNSRSDIFVNSVNRPDSPIGRGWCTSDSVGTNRAFIKLVESGHDSYLPTRQMRPFNKDMDFSVITVLRSDTTTAHDTFGSNTAPKSPGMPIYPAVPKMQYQIMGLAGADATTTAVVGGIYAYGCSARNTTTNPHPYALYFDGRQVGSGSYAGAAGAEWFVPFIGTFAASNYAVGNGADYMTFFFFGFWDRWLSKEEHQLIARIALNDREMFTRTGVDRFYIPPSFRASWIRQRGALIGGGL